MTVCKVVSQFCICSLHVNEDYKSVRLQVRGICLQRDCLDSSYWWVGFFILARAWERLARQTIVNWPAWLQWKHAWIFCWQSCLAGVRDDWLTRSCIWSSLGAGPMEFDKAWWWIQGANHGIWTSDSRKSGQSLCLLSNWIHWVISSGSLSIRYGPLTSSWKQSANSSWKWSLWLDSSHHRFWARRCKVVTFFLEKLSSLSTLVFTRGFISCFVDLPDDYWNSRRKFSYCFNRELW